MKNKDPTGRLANFSKNAHINLERKNLMSFSFLTQKEASDYTNIDVGTIVYLFRLKFYHDHLRVSSLSFLKSLDP